LRRVNRVDLSNNFATFTIVLIDLDGLAILSKRMA